MSKKQRICVVHADVAERVISNWLNDGYEVVHCVAEQVAVSAGRDQLELKGQIIFILKWVGV